MNMYIKILVSKIYINKERCTSIPSFKQKGKRASILRLPYNEHHIS